MATNNMVPYSNPAGNNQMTPKIGGVPGTGLNQGGTPGGPIGVVVGATGTGVSLAQQNPLVPPTSSTTGTVPTAQVSQGDSFNAGSTSTNQQNTQNQLADIYGQGVGTDLTNLLSSIGGTDSATLQEFKQSLVPQEAKAQADLNASLGAAGVSANSSVAAIGDANLQAQETAAIAGETANLTQSGQSLEAQLLSGTEGAAIKEVASSGWDVFGQVLGDIGSAVGDVMGLGGITGGLGKIASGTGASDLAQVNQVTADGNSF